MKAMIIAFDAASRRQLLSKARELEYEPLILNPGKTFETGIDILEKAVRREAPELLLIEADPAGEEIAPALGVRLGTGVAAHCVDIKRKDDGRLAFMVPAFGGRVIGEIFVPAMKAGRPAIATVKPGIFPDIQGSGYGEEIVCENCEDRQTVAVSERGAVPRGFVLENISDKAYAAKDIGKANLIVCGGYGIGSKENWTKIERLAELLGGAAGCTRPVVDAGFGPDEYSMIGTSGRTVNPKIYIAFGVSGAAHHLCGIKDAGTIISINNDEKAEIFSASDYCGKFDAAELIEALTNLLTKEKGL